MGAYKGLTDWQPGYCCATDNIITKAPWRWSSPEDAVSFISGKGQKERGPKGGTAVWAGGDDSGESEVSVGLRAPVADD